MVLPYIETAKSYLNGYTLSDGTFSYHPNAPATREDIVVAMVKLKGFDSKRISRSNFQTSTTPSHVLKQQLFYGEHSSMETIIKIKNKEVKQQYLIN